MIDDLTMILREIVNIYTQNYLFQILEHIYALKEEIKSIEQNVFYRIINNDFIYIYL